MRGRKSTLRVELTDEQRTELERRLRSPSTPLGMARRCRVVLEIERGQSVTHAATAAGLTQRNARKWLRRFIAAGLAGLTDRPGRGRKPARPDYSQTALG